MDSNYIIKWPSVWINGCLRKGVDEGIALFKARKSKHAPLQNADEMCDIFFLTVQNLSDSVPVKKL